MSTITIPSAAVIPCPASAFRMRHAAQCPECPHFAGIVDTQPSAPDKTPFSHRYRIGCSHPVARRVEMIEVANAGAG